MSSPSDISSLSSAPTTDDEVVKSAVRGGNLDHYFKTGNASTKASPPPKKKRAPSPPHEYGIADNPDIAFIIMFRSRFSDAFPKSLPHYGPQDIENGVVSATPGEQVERLLCALLGLVLNRKKEVEKLHHDPRANIYVRFNRRGHFGRALEEAVHTHPAQWAGLWGGRNPLHQGGSFTNMSPEQRVTLLKTLIEWSLGSSEAIQSILKESYKQQRHDDDLNQPLSVQPWGRDGDKRRYWLVEGQDDTHFRLYRESNPTLKHNTWRTVAGTIEELKEVANRLGDEGSQAGRRLQERINLAIPRFEASEEKRKRRDYRNARKAQFTRPEPGFSLYEGRTRGKRIRYTFSDDEEMGSDEPSTRQSNRQSGVSTPTEPVGPTFTASGRQVRSRFGGTYGEAMLGGHHDGPAEGSATNMQATDVLDDQPLKNDRPARSGNPRPKDPRAARKHIEGYNDLDEMEDESDASSTGNEWDGGDEQDIDDNVADDAEGDADMSQDDASVDEEEDLPQKHSLVVSLRYQAKNGEHRLITKDELENGAAINDAKPITKTDIKPAAPDVYHQFTAPNIISNGYSQPTEVPRASESAEDGNTELEAAKDLGPPAESGLKVLSAPLLSSCHVPSTETTRTTATTTKPP